VRNFLAQAPAASRIVVLGITDQSFAQPYILLAATVPDDAGYFGERLEAARRQLVAVWQRRISKLQPTFKHTDLLGALLVANQLFDESPNPSRKILMVFSDMRNSTQELDLESLRSIPGLPVFEQRFKLPVAELRGVEVYAFGVDGGGKSIPYWQTLKGFWTEYFKRAGATLREYSVLRQVPKLAASK
jgi:hypothetical protein